MNDPEHPTTSVVLVVDDIAANRNLLRETLEPRGYEVLLAGNGQTALKVAHRVKPDVILLDVMMPGMDGFETCRQLKAAPETRGIPVLFITAENETSALVNGFQAGGVDYVIKPIRAEEVLARVETHLKINRLTSELARANDELTRTNEELRREVDRRTQAEQAATKANQAKSDFLSFVSHEMRSPLNSIIGFSDLLVADLDNEESPEALGDLRRINRSGKYLLDLINNLLDLSKIEAGKMELHLERFDLSSLAEDILATLEPAAKKNSNTLRLECPADLGAIYADVVKVKQTLMNLVANACKFTEHGTVELKLEREDRDGKPTVLMEVTDTGIGMTPEQVSRLFKAYAQAAPSTSKKYGGTGLGLAISRKCCLLMGGDITVSSEPGNGSTFRVTLPAEVSSEQPNAAADASP
jgi:signal transduction histidine kinase